MSKTYPPVALSEAPVNILVVDDSPANARAVEGVLEPLGQTVIRAESGTQALRCLLERDFAVVLLDIQMPGLDGLETAELIRARERTRQLPIIFMTAFSRDDRLLAQAYELGAVDFLFKPIVPFILRAKVQAFVNLYRKTLELERQAASLRAVEQLESRRRLAEAAQRWEGDRLREEMIQERSVAATLLRTAADRARAEAALHASNLRLRVLSDVANRLLVGDRPRDFLESLYAQVAAHLRLEVFFEVALHDDGSSPTLDCFGGIDAGPSLELLVREGEPVSRAVALSREQVVAEHVQSSPDPSLASLRALGLEAYACFPIVAQERLFGTLSFGTRRRPTFEPDDISVIQVVCDQVATALERARLIAELSGTNAELARNDRRKDEFLAMLAHELRNPMAPILSAVELLRTPGASKVAAKRALEALERQTLHLVRLVDDLLDLSRITTGKIDLRRETVTVASIVKHALQLALPGMVHGDHPLESRLPAEEITLLGDGTRLSQVIANLLDNAAKYSPKGASVWLDIERQGGELVVRVRDEGMGIRADMLEAIFGLFIQGERTPERAQGGLGIGLTLVKNLVELHGGTVQASSPGLGRGAEFTIRLPLTEGLSGEASPSRAPAPVRPSGTARRVVVVEDNPDVAETMKDMLEAWGHEVNLASDGPEGVEVVLLLRPDVALIDIGLPGLDGYQVVTSLLERAPRLATRLVALTGYGRPEDRARSLEAGFDHHVVKPVTPSELAKLIEPRGAR
jgi:CheY-like chemotaxis protein/GAF domain-containing protein